MDEGSCPPVSGCEREASQIIFIDRMDMDIDYPWHDILSSGIDQTVGLFRWKLNFDGDDFFSFDPHIRLSDFRACYNKAPSDYKIISVPHLLLLLPSLGA
jgi:hypothetical protein